MDQGDKHNTRSLAPSSEIMAVVFGNVCRTDAAFRAQLKDDPKRKLADLLQTDVDTIPKLQVHIAQNTADTVHVPLPCYQALSLSDEMPLSDDALAEISGGEIIFSVIFGALVAVGVGVGATSVGIAGAVGCAAVGAAVVGSTVAVAAAPVVVAGGATLIAHGAGAI